MEAKPLDRLYSLMNSIEGRLGGGEGVEGIYGSITQTGMQKVFDCLAESCGLGPRSTLVDIGAGLGRPIIHALASHGIAGGFGIELDAVKVTKAGAFIRQTLEGAAVRNVMAHPVNVPAITCAPVERMASLDPATHAYSFWEGVPLSGKAAFGRLFAESKTLKASN